MPGLHPGRHGSLPCGATSKKIIRSELNKADALEIGLNQLQSATIWEKSERYDSYGSEMFKLRDGNLNEMILSGTNEELVTMVAKSCIESYKDLPFCFYQINNKFRDEIRCNAGLIRSKEFLMMDAYSFHNSKKDMQEYYSRVKTCYISIFDKLDLRYMREQLIDMFSVYNPLIKIIYVEVPYKKLIAQNKNREHPIPEDAIEHMIDKLEVPKDWEGHEVVNIIN